MRPPRRTRSAGAALRRCALADWTTPRRPAATRAGRNHDSDDVCGRSATVHRRPSLAPRYAQKLPPKHLAPGPVGSRRRAPSSIARCVVVDRLSASRAGRTTSRCRRAAASGPTQSSARAKTSASVRPGWSLIQLFELDVSSTDVRRRVGGHQRLAKEAGAEVRNDHRHLRMADGDGGDGQRIAEPQIEPARQTELLADADRQHAAVHEHRARRGAAAAANTALDRSVVERARGASRETGTPSRRSSSPNARSRRASASGAGGLNMNAPTNRVRMTRDCGRDRRLVARHARDQHRARDAVSIELGHPSIRQRLVVAGRIPAESRGQIDSAASPGGAGTSRPSVRKNPDGKEMTVRVAMITG